MRDIVLADPAPFRRLAEGLEVKDVRLDERRYVVCRAEPQPINGTPSGLL